MQQEADDHIEEVPVEAKHESGQGDSIGEKKCTQLDQSTVRTALATYQATAAGRTGKDRVAKKQLDREGEVHYLLIGKLDDTVLADEKKIMELYCLQE